MPELFATRRRMAGGPAPSPLLRSLVCAAAFAGTDCSGATANDIFAQTAGDGGLDVRTPPPSGERDAAVADTNAAASVTCAPASQCPVPSQVCCRADGGDTCMAPNACGALAGLSIACDGPGTCSAGGHPELVCCVTVDSRGTPTAVACQAPARCTGAQLSTPVCNGADSTGCPSGLACQPSTQTLPGYMICR